MVVVYKVEDWLVDAAIKSDSLAIVGKAVVGIYAKDASSAAVAGLEGRDIWTMTADSPATRIWFGKSKSAPPRRRKRFTFSGVAPMFLTSIYSKLLSFVAIPGGGSAGWYINSVMRRGGMET